MSSIPGSFASSASGSFSTTSLPPQNSSAPSGSSSAGSASSSVSSIPQGLAEGPSFLSSCVFHSQGQVIELLATNASVEKTVKDIEQTRYSINIEKAMLDLKLVGRSLQIAYAASQGYQCSSPIMDILTSYQTLVNDSTTVCRSFIDTCLKSLKNHRTAINFAESNPEMTLKVLARCAAQAEAMAGLSGEMAGRAKTLVGISDLALKGAQSEDTLTQKQIREAEIMRDALEIKEARSKATAEKLAVSLEAQRNKQKEIMSKLGKAKNSRFWHLLVKGVAAPVTLAVKTCMAIPGLVREMITGASVNADQLRKEIGEIRVKIASKQERLKQVQMSQGSNASAIEVKIVELQAQLHNKERELGHQEYVLETMRRENETEIKLLEALNAEVEEKRGAMEREQDAAKIELAESVVELKNSFDRSRPLNRAVDCLRVAVQSLGHIRTTFDNSRLYWQSVKDHCVSLTDQEDAKLYLEGENIGAFTQEITASGYQWLAMARTNWKALLATEEVKSTVDEVMSHLPTTEEARGLIDTMCKQVVEIVEPNA